MPKSKKAGSDSQYMLLEIEKSKLNREKCVLLLDKALLLYFAFLIIGIVGFINNYIDANTLTMMIFLGFGVLAVGLVPYVLTMSREEKRLDELMRGRRA